MLPLPQIAQIAQTALMFLKLFNTFSPINTIPQIIPLLLSGPLQPNLALPYVAEVE